MLDLDRDKLSTGLTINQQWQKFINKNEQNYIYIYIYI